MKLVYLQGLDQSTVRKLSLSASKSNASKLVSRNSTMMSDDNDKAFSPSPSSFALLRANHIVGLAHLQAAGNMSLLRCMQNQASPARETIVCVAGSSNPTHAISNYGLLFNDSMEMKMDDEMSLTNVIFLGFDCSDDDFKAVFDEASINLDAHIRPFSTLQQRYFTSNGSVNEDFVKSIIKAYKLTREEVDAFGIEQSVIHRVATKFVT